MFKQSKNQSKNATVDTLIGPKTRINGDVEFTVHIGQFEHVALDDTEAREFLL